MLHADAACRGCMRSKTDSKIKFRDFFFRALKEEIDAMDRLPVQQK